MERDLGGQMAIRTDRHNGHHAGAGDQLATRLHMTVPGLIHTGDRYTLFANGRPDRVAATASTIEVTNMSLGGSG